MRLMVKTSLWIKIELFLSHFFSFNESCLFSSFIGTRFARAPHNNDIVAGTDNPDQDCNQAVSRPRLRK